MDKRFLREQDHPRVCGEHGCGCDGRATNVGSPPRLRGARSLPGCSHLRPRITPAFAGSTIWWFGGGDPVPDHPRVCGEHTVTNNQPRTACGSPPRLRGAHDRALRMGDQLRITPAFAGSTTRCGYPRRGSEDHPRVCGEHGAEFRAPLRCYGSPPRLRGARSRRGCVRAPPRITPAFAGSTRGSRAGWSGGSDHPRVCGEHNQSRIQRRHNRGSPPRLRGAHRRFPFSVGRLRITPAFAGSTFGIDSDGRSVRITPAFAGSTRFTTGLRCWRSDHPRVCGEHSTSPAVAFAVCGSPPRLRGALPERVREEVEDRITPAFAGSTSCVTQ